SVASSCLLSFRPTAPTERSTLSLHDALPILAILQSSAFVALARSGRLFGNVSCPDVIPNLSDPATSSSGIPDWIVLTTIVITMRSEEHTSELQSRENLVCRLLLEKKKVVVIR